MIQNKYQLIVNIKSKGYTGTIPSVTANDNIVFDIQVYDGAVPFDLTGVSKFTLVSMKEDGTSVIREGTLVNGIIEFVLGSSETTESGRVNATVQLYDADNKRVSSAPLIYQVISDPSLNGSLPADESSLTYIYSLNNNNVSYDYYEDGTIQTITVSDSQNQIIKTLTINYNLNGDITSSTTVMNGKTIDTQYNYDENGQIKNITNTIS